MASTNSTANLHLNQWIGADKPKMEDFNADNRTLDATIGSHLSGATGHITEAERTAWNKGMPVIGSYVGNGISIQVIELGFKPSFGILFGVNQNIVTAVGSSGNMQVFSAFLSANGCSQGAQVTETGFKAMYNTAVIANRMALTNVKDQVYIYLMFR